MLVSLSVWAAGSVRVSSARAIKCTGNSKRLGYVLAVFCLVNVLIQVVNADRRWGLGQGCKRGYEAVIQGVN